MGEHMMRRVMFAAVCSERNRKPALIPEIPVFMLAFFSAVRYNRT